MIVLSERDKTFNGRDYNWLYLIIWSTDGGYAVAGYIESKGAGEEIWITKLLS